MQIEFIEIKNFRLFRDTRLTNIPRLCVLVGANGTGKTTLFDVFSFLKDALVMNVGKAVAKRGGFRELASRGFAHEPIEITLQFRLEITGRERLVTYLLKVEPDLNGRPVVAREVLRYKRSSYGAPFHFLDFTYGKGYAITNEEDFSKADESLSREEQELDGTDILAIKGLGQFDRFKAASAFRQMIESWHISDFHVSEARPSQEDGYAEHLSTRGDNLPLVANYLFEHHRDCFDGVLDAMKRRVPGVSVVEAKPTEDGRLVLRFQDGSFKDPFIARYVSDGTIKMFAYLVLLHDPKPFPLLAVEEPENQLYPELLPELAEEFRDYAERGGQVFISTHSPDFLNALTLDEIYCLKKEDGFTVISRASDSDNLRSLFDQGDLPGYLWKQGLFEGVNR
ncbi:AAA family ATPase [Burkholderia gladioli]|uniref:AAA ATPase domain protein n=1 Tax=Burkholderia gladioli TaxID=28095 RepID=A0AAP8S8A7_BURGA|nr:AAA family ATPase [Burkholderia gladioli]AJW99213.1 AAA ATPase domain protein [Burkholderia gladioli]ASD80541.1 chromosome segregation protein SMC [Burkholderia gladioli pv. gladioli]AWY54222.1 chromosome segregation protein SMC [Burkholderia gladioli pv. gladioli]KGC17117.1 AAA ATPase domain protein [Burkholderia gladioli]MBJ9674639.1 AAA family ATPase [Burkholderia gladioli]